MRKSELSKKVMRSLAVSTSRAPLTRDSSGNAPIVISLPYERVSDVFLRAQRVMSDGMVNIAIAYSTKFEMLSFDASRQTEIDLEVNGDLSMGMLTIRMNNHPGKAFRINMNDQSIDVPASFSLEYA